MKQGNLTPRAFDIYFNIYIFWTPLHNQISSGSQVELLMHAGGNMDTAKLFFNGRSQAVRLPKRYRFQGNEVYIKKVPNGVLLIPKESSVWDVWEKNLKKHKKTFLTKRNQPSKQQIREGLDEIFD